MTARRAAGGPSPGIRLVVDGTPVPARAGESVATALMAAGRMVFRRSPGQAGPRGPFCLMGVCQECVVRIDGVRRPACTVAAEDAMVVETGP